MSTEPTERLLPLVVGLGMAVAGAALLARKPEFMALPDADEDRTVSEDDPAMARLAGKGRDAITRAMPDNASTVISRPLLIAGAAMMIVGLLDEVAARGR